MDNAIKVPPLVEMPKLIGIVRPLSGDCSAHAVIFVRKPLSTF